MECCEIVEILLGYWISQRFSSFTRIVEILLVDSPRNDLTEDGGRVRSYGLLRTRIAEEDNKNLKFATQRTHNWTLFRAVSRCLELLQKNIVIL